MLLFTDTVDDFWVNVNSEYKGHAIKSATRSDIDVDQATSSPEEKNKDEKKSDDEYKSLTDYFKETLGSLVKDVKISKKLTSSPACLAVSEAAMDIRMERFLIEQKQIAAASAKNLELNPKNKIIEKIFNDLKPNYKNIEELVKLIFDQACILEGEPVADTGAFSKRLNDIVQKAKL